MASLTGESQMPWGKYKGEKMANVPASYLLWVYENRRVEYSVSKYIFDNLDCIKEEVRRESEKHK